MIIAAALCPSPPLLVRELTGADPVAADLREACAAAVGALLTARPEVIVVVGTGPQTNRWPAEGRLNVAAFGGQTLPARPGQGSAIPSAAASTPTPAAPAAETATPPAGAVPRSVGLGAYLLDQAGYTGPRELHSVSQDESPADCLRLGKEIGATDARAGLLVMADGSARRGLRAPGHLDERAAPFDAGVERAVRAGDLQALGAVDPGLARELMATGRPAWQVLAGAADGAALRADVMYADDPFGVMYLVAFFAPLAA
jgi:hypothetical protein